MIPTSSLRQPLICFLFLINLLFLDILHEWNHIIHGVCCVVSFGKHGFEVHPYSNIYHISFLCTPLYLIPCMAVAHILYPFIGWWTFGFISLFGYKESCSEYSHVGLCEDKFSFLLGGYLRVELLCCMVNLCIFF